MTPGANDAVPDEILVEQRAYYDERAGEYDDWFFRRGRYDRGEVATAAWFAEVGEVRAQLGRVGWDGSDTVELAPGTGLWTQWLRSNGARLSVVDASRAMLGELRARVGETDIEFTEADLFEWTAPRTYERVFFAFWLSHVPRERLDSFFVTVAGALSPSGRFCFVDSLREDSSTATDHVLPIEGDEVMVRRLDDGREFRIVKNFFEPDELVASAERAGLRLRVSRTERYFCYGVGEWGSTTRQSPS